VRDIEQTGRFANLTVFCDDAGWVIEGHLVVRELNDLGIEFTM
jgi:hypothetical protein